MALSSTTVWEVRTAGNDANGGGFKPGASGTDFSQQNSPQYALTGIATAGAGATFLTASAAADMVGNVLQVISGTNFTTGFFEVASVVVGVSVTVDRSICTGVGSDGVINIGGALASPGMAGAAHIGSNVIYKKSGTYSITNSSSNVSGGRITLTGGTGTAPTRLIGYNATRDDYGTKPILQASGISSVAIITGASHTNVENITVDGASLTSIRGFTGVDVLWLCKAMGCTNSGFDASVLHLACEATGCGTAGSAFQPASTSIFIGCNAHDNTVTGFNGVGTYIDCISESNSGGSTDGFNNAASGTAKYYNCTAYNNGRHGFQKQGGGSRGEYMGCLSYGNASNDFDTSEASDSGCLLIKCAGVNVDAQILRNLNFVTLSADPFTSGAAGDLSLNTTAGGGAACRAAGIFGAFPGGTTTGYRDIGAVQHQDSGGGGSVPRFGKHGDGPSFRGAA